MDSFACKTAAEEARYFRLEDDIALMKRIQKFKEGNLLNSEKKYNLTSLEKVRVEASRQALLAKEWTPTKVKGKPRALQVNFSHTAGAHLHQTENVLDYLKLPRVNLGKQKWEQEANASIFSIQDGKRLATTAVEMKHTKAQLARQAHVEASALDHTVYKGYRLYPKFSAGRALMWGSLLAVWGTAAIFIGAKKVLNINNRDDLEQCMVKGFDKPVEHIKNTVKTLDEKVLKSSYDMNPKNRRFLEDLRNKIVH